eukprot:2872394-Pleurochrysis_carterae.AAC.1
MRNVLCDGLQRQHRDPPIGVHGQPMLLRERLGLLGERIHAWEHGRDVDEVGIAEGIVHQDARHVQIKRSV